MKSIGRIIQGCIKETRIKETLTHCNLYNKIGKNLTNRMKSSLYLTGRWILTAYINLWRSNEITSDVFKASLSDLAAFCQGEKRLIYENLMGLMEVGFLSHIKSNEVEGTTVQVGLSFEVISAIVERSFEYPFEEPEQTTDAIFGQFLLAGTREITFPERHDDGLV